MSLSPWKVDFCGAFVFVCRADAPPPLKDFIGEKWSEISIISEALGDEIDCLKTIYDANWKICVENTLDEYHAKFVHPSTFRQMLGSEFEYEYWAAGSTMRVGADEEFLKKWKRADRLVFNRSIVTDNYFHHHLFPNTTIASSFGASFSVQVFTPLAADRTELVSRLYFSKSDAPQNIVTALGQSAMEFNRTVFEEDRVICNQVQAGISLSAHRGQLGRYEQRIAHFQSELVRRAPSDTYRGLRS